MRTTLPPSMLRSIAEVERLRVRDAGLPPMAAPELSHRLMKTRVERDRIAVIVAALAARRLLIPTVAVMDLLSTVPRNRLIPARSA